MKKIITFLFLVLFSISYGQVAKENKKKSKSQKKEIPVSVNPKSQDSIMRLRGGIQSEDGQTWSVPREMSATHPEKEDIKIYERKEVEVTADFIDNKMDQFLDENFVISKKVKEQKKNGDINLSFVVEKDGSLSAFKIIKDLGYDTGKELERVIKLGKWYPSELNGKKVRSLFNLTYTIKNNND